MTRTNDILRRAGGALALLAGVLLPTLAAAQEAEGEAAANGGGGGEGGGGWVSVDAILETLNDQVAPWGIKILGALIGIFLSFMVAGWISRRVRKVGESRNLDVTLVRFASNMVRWVVLAAALIAILGYFGFQTSSFAAIIGAAGLAIGLAFEGTLGNFASGVMLLVFRPFEVGDWVKAGGESGTVEEIELFFCVLRTLDNRKVIVPNKAVFGDVIINNQGFDVRRVDIDVGVDYGADIDETRKVLEAILPNVEAGLEDPAPQVFLKGLGASSVDWQVRVWCKTDDFWTVYQSIIRETKYALDGAGIGIPFPQMDVHLDEDVVKAIGKK